MVWCWRGVSGVGVMWGKVGGQREGGVNRVRRVVEELGEAEQCKGWLMQEAVKGGDVCVFGSYVYTVLYRCRVTLWWWRCGRVCCVYRYGQLV